MANEGDVAPRHASTIVLLRRGGAGLETLLLRRHRASGFMAGAFVFPGGKLDPSDYAPAVLERVEPEVQAASIAALDPTPGVDLTDDQKVGLFVAACRETFEEAGALFATRGNDADLGAIDLPSWRARLNARETTFVELLVSEDLVPRLENIHYFAHWVTPSAERRRFDTRFFVAEVPEGQTPTYDRHETVEERWLTPSDALDQHHAGAIFLPPPTQRTLEELADATTFEAVAARAIARRSVITPIMPKVAFVEGTVTILLPWDPLYEETDGVSMAASDPEPEKNRASRIAVVPPST